MWDWGSEKQAITEKANILVKQIRALGSQAGLPFELYVSVPREAMGLALFQRQ